MAKALEANFRERRKALPPPKSIEISSIRHNIYFMKKGGRKFPSAIFLGKHPESNKVFMLFGKPDNPMLFAGNTDNKLWRCKRCSVTPFMDQGRNGEITCYTIEFSFKEKIIAITVPADTTDSYLYSDADAHTVSLKNLEFRFIK